MNSYLVLLGLVITYLPSGKMGEKGVGNMGRVRAETRITVGYHLHHLLYTYTSRSGDCYSDD